MRLDQSHTPFTVLDDTDAGAVRGPRCQLIYICITHEYMGRGRPGANAVRCSQSKPDREVALGCSRLGALGSSSSVLIERWTVCLPLLRKEGRKEGMGVGTG